MTQLLTFLIHLLLGPLVERVVRRDMLLSPGTPLHNRYVIGKVHEQGQENAVYLAYDKLEDRDVAIKENGRPGREAYRQFESEAAILANLSHPAIPGALDFFVEDRFQFIVMEFIEGPNLQQVIGGRRPKTDEILNWAAQLCDLLDDLHRLRPPVVHLDVEPANIVLGQDGQLFLVDFGAAQTGWPGSEGSPIDPGSDQRLLAATLYALLTGTSRRLSREWLAADPALPSIRAARPDLSFYAEEAILRAMSPLPDGCYRDMQDFKSALGC